MAMSWSGRLGSLRSGLLLKLWAILSVWAFAPLTFCPTCGIYTSNARTQHLRRAVDGEDVPLFDEPEWSAAPAVWPSHLRDAFVSLSPNEAATDFVLEAPIAPLPQAFLYQALCQLPLNEFDLQALLYPASSHLITKEQLEKLFSHAGMDRLAMETILDVGAGDGCITKHLRDLGASVVTTETSLGRACRLRMSGYEVWCEEYERLVGFVRVLWSSGVSCF
ncbi:Methyltransferase-like protein 9 [Durusdinium trenchii]|uniref:Methyltransferase-like protein 9 n=1 Tax=Durusdinium trenchii TaxID=1381693 RepID=A0ABP0P403_9DINO